MELSDALLRELIREELIRKLRERGMGFDIQDDADLVLKSGDLRVGVVLFLLGKDKLDAIADRVKRFLESGQQVYVLIERAKEKEVVSQALSCGLAGKVKFISWELRFYGI